MSRAGTFNLVLRDERLDQFFQATDYLRNRLARIRAKRRREGQANPHPTFRDLKETHLFYLRGTYRPFVSVASEYIRVNPSGDGAFISTSGGSVKFDFKTYGHFTSDMVFHVRFNDLGTSTTSATTPFYRYCAYPGMRLFKRVSFRSSQTLIDDYDRDEVSFKNKFRVPESQRAAWDHSMGQAPVLNAEVFHSNGYTQVFPYREGLQTPKFFHPSQDLWVPLQFWMCGDSKDALLNDLIPNTQRTITVDLAPISEIIQAIDQTTGEVTTLPISKLGMQIDLYINNLFVNPEIHEIFASRMGTSLIRVHRRQYKILNQSEGSVLMDQLKYPVEYMYMGIRDRVNLDDFDYWHLFGVPRAHTSLATAILAPVSIWNTGLGVCQFMCRLAKPVHNLEPLAESVKLTAHGIDLFPELPPTFFSTYLPQRYHPNTLVTAPKDRSAMLATFCLYPGTHNPSGYYNLSSGRELYVSYKASSVGTTITTSNIAVTLPANTTSRKVVAEMVTSVSALNLLVRRGDKVSLRYSL